MKRLGHRGQTATEYVLILSVVVLGLLAAASALIPSMGQGVTLLTESLANRFANNPLTECGPGAQCGNK
ncbi:MAG: hypothetical protein HYV02_04470 [Deltaproteobacteria bacterium]|nr:hypothetical protein [Deltaproteobacteria bacterium]